MKKTLCLTLAALLGLSACSAERISLFPSYKLKVIQGNELDARQLEQLHTGMTRDQVQLLLGTPLLQDPFHANRWDYVFTVRRNGIREEQTNLTLYFENNILSRIEGDAAKAAPANQ